MTFIEFFRRHQLIAVDYYTQSTTPTLATLVVAPHRVDFLTGDTSDSAPVPRAEEGCWRVRVSRLHAIRVSALPCTPMFRASRLLNACSLVHHNPLLRCRRAVRPAAGLAASTAVALASALRTLRTSRRRTAAPASVADAPVRPALRRLRAQHVHTTTPAVVPDAQA